MCSFVAFFKSMEGFRPMARPAIPLTLLAATLAGALHAAPAHAQVTRTFVSGMGNDANPCTLAAPCRTMQGAFNLTAAGGEINVLDAAGYGALGITHAISIQGHGWASMSPGTGTGELTELGPGVITIVAGASDKISLRGLILEGFGIGHANGILFRTGAALDVQDSVIHNFTNNGIFFSASTGALHVSNTEITANTIGINGQADASANATITLRHVRISDGTTGVLLGGGSNANSLAASLDDCEISNNSSIGVDAAAPAGVNIRRSTFAFNGTAVVTDESIVLVMESTFYGNNVGLAQAQAAVGTLPQSFGGNNTLINNSGQTFSLTFSPK
jgi:hypothetical protein